jgi:hypothetical protein
MSLTGYLSEYSLAEIFYFIQKDNKTGLLSIEPDRSSNPLLSDTYHISFQSGRIMSVVDGDRSVQQGCLLKTIEERGWLLLGQIAELKSQISSLHQPFGNYLKSYNMINTEQLILIFNAQVVAKICKIFVEVHHGCFRFDPQAQLAYAEMTGLSMTAKQATLMGLGLLRDWSHLTAKLPAPESALQRLFAEPTGVRLDRQESLVWDLAKGEMSISKIAKNLGLETTRVQQIGFRLSVIGLMDEVSTQPSQKPLNLRMDLSKTIAPVNARSPVSTSFLSNLMTFLKPRG